MWSRVWFLRYFLKSSRKIQNPWSWFCLRGAVSKWGICGTFWSAVLRSRCIYQRSSIIFQKSTLEQGPLSKAQSHFLKIVVNFSEIDHSFTFWSRLGDFSQRLFTKNPDLIFRTHFFHYHFLPKIKTKIKAFLDQGFQFFILSPITLFYFRGTLSRSTPHSSIKINKNTPTPLILYNPM